MTDATLIGLILGIPLVAALLIVISGRYPNLRETVTLAASLSLLAAVAMLAMRVAAGGRPELYLIEMLPGVGLAFSVEPLGVLFAVIASLLWPVNSAYSIGYMRGLKEKNQTRYYVCFAIAIFGVMGVAMSGNLLTLFVFYEVLTLSTYPLVTHKGNDGAMKAGRVYLGILLTTSIAFLLVAIIWTYVVAGTLDFVPGGILTGAISGTSAGLLLMLYIFGIGKAAIMPVHRWLPAAMVAPTPVSALLHAVAVVKAGVFTVTKVVLYTFGPEMMRVVPSQQFLLYLAGFTVLAASAVALRQTEFKRLLAYSTISQLSYVIMAALAITPHLLPGAAVHIAAHAFGKITLFFTAGAVYVASKKTSITQFRGIGRRMPITMGAFTLGALSMIGVPPTAGFVSKWYLVAGAYDTGSYFVLAVLILSTGLNAAYFLPIVARAFFENEDHPPAKDHGEAPWPMVLAIVITASLTLGFFVFNAPIAQWEYMMLGGKK